MAGSSLNEMNEVIDGWLLDLACHRSWEEFRERKQVSNRDLISGILSSGDNSEKEGQVHFLLMLCKLSDGQDYGARYSTDSDNTVLEEVLISFDTLVKTVRSSDECQRFSKHRVAIMMQAVFVCCRAGDFEAAEGVFQRVWSDVSRTEKAERKIVEGVIKSKNKDHKKLRETYEHFLDIMMEFLSKCSSALSEPSFIKLARAYMKVRKSHHLGTPLRKRKYKIQSLVSLGNELGQRQNGDEQRHRSPGMEERIGSVREKVWENVVAESKEDGNNSNVRSASDDSEIDLDEEPRPSPAKVLKTTPKKDSPRKKKTDESDVSYEPSDSESEENPQRRTIRNMKGKMAPLPKLRLSLNLSPKDKKNQPHKRIFWSEKEEAELYLAVQDIGEGKWSEIKKHLKTFRTQVNLKDKWRQIKSSGRLKALERKVKVHDE